MWPPLWFSRLLDLGRRLFRHTGFRQPDQRRAIRVFVSSTFSDMKEEREELVKQVFLPLNRLCRQRGVTWGEVDLRWGVTEEQKAEGKVLPICLAEIRRCRPYFIGILGERYGWVPDEIPPRLKQRERWLKRYGNRSVTELEILHGVLNNPQMAGHAFFYFRDPAFSNPTPQFQEQPTAEEVERLGLAKAEMLAEERRGRLNSLKQRIRDASGNAGFTVRENYPSPQELGKLVLQDLTAVIDRLYPEGSQPGPLDQEAAGHGIFERARTSVYVGGTEDLRRLDAHARGHGPPLVVAGDSGCGKSALLANWAAQHRKSHPREYVLTHFVGATPSSTDWAAMLRRIMGELGRQLGIRQVIPETPDSETPDRLRVAFADSLHQAAAKTRLVLIIDGLDQLEDRQGAPDLVWLPLQIPASVRLVVSTLPGRPLVELERRGWPVLSVGSLQPRQRVELVRGYLREFSKALNAQQEGRITGNRNSSNPLFLQTLLEELRLFGSHEELDRWIDDLLSSEGLGALYEKILGRYEQDYERDRRGLVHDAMSFLWAARRGLAERELLSFLGRNDGPLPMAHWSPLSLAAESLLVDRSGLIGFSHSELRQAIESRYLATETQRQAAHLRLGRHFRRLEVESRKVEELPWQLSEAHSWKRLYRLLAERGFFESAWAANPFDVRFFWARIEQNAGPGLVQAYRDLLQVTGPVDDPQLLKDVALLLRQTGHPAEALTLRTRLVEYYRGTGERADLARALGSRALILRDWGRTLEAMALHEEQEAICRDLDDQRGIQRALCNRGLILRELGRFDEAMVLHREEEDICRRLGDRVDLAKSIGNQAVLRQLQGDSEEALRLSKEAELICREMGERDGLTALLSDRAKILVARGDLKGAMSLLQEGAGIARDLGDKSGLARCLGNEGSVRLDAEDPAGAVKCLAEAEAIHRELGDRVALVQCLLQQAIALLKSAGSGCLQQAIDKLEEAHALAVECQLPPAAEQIGKLLEWAREQRR